MRTLERYRQIEIEFCKNLELYTYILVCYCKLLVFNVKSFKTTS